MFELRRYLLAVFLLMTSSSVFGESVTYLAAGLAEGVPGIGGSVWRSELRFFNNDTVAHKITFLRHYPFTNVTCTLPAPITVGPKASIQLKSFGCGSPTATSLEFSLDEHVLVTVLTVNVQDALQDPCCYSGFAGEVPAVNLGINGFTTHRVVHSLPLPWDPRTPEASLRHLIRHNAGVVNPNPFDIMVQFSLIDAAGNEFSFGGGGSVAVPAGRTVQRVDLYAPGEPSQVGGPGRLPPGYYAMVATASAPFYLSDAQIDNQTNDATIFASVPLRE